MPNFRNVVVVSRSTTGAPLLQSRCGICPISMLGGRGTLEMPALPPSQSELIAVSRMISPNPRVTMAR